MPDVTSEEAFAGRKGLIVVLARLKAILPAKAMRPPLPAITPAPTVRRRGGRSSDGPLLETNHITAPISTAITGGGIFNSSAFIRHSMRPNDKSSATPDQ